ncbi:MAG: HD-GYP domain-containing protein [Phycisphaerae bacterium]
MASKITFKPIDTAFAILFLLLIVVAILHVTTVTDMGEQYSAEVLQMPAELERFRALERDVRASSDHLKSGSLDRDAKVAVLDTELGYIESALHDLGRSGLKVSGLTRLVEPYMHIRDVRQKIQANADDVDALLAAGGPLDRALQATLFVVRNNITRLGDELSLATASVNGSKNQARQIAVLGGLAAVLVFVPVRLMAGRTAAKPIRALKAATHAVAEERWSAASIECEPGDAVGDLVVAFHTMADKLRESRQERTNAFRRTLASLVQTIEAKDAFVSNHSCNVSKLAELLARARGLPEADVKEVAYGGLLHDIGKIGVPDEIINKPGALTTEEFSRIQEHPAIGDRIVTPLDGSEVLLPPVRHHHEHWDGSGYPDGLRGEQIPLVARIIAVADVFESLISDRPYRDRMSVEQAVDVLRSEAGKTLAPELVDTFLSKVLPKIKHLLPDPPRELASGDSQADSHTAGKKLHLLHAR